MAEGRKVAPAVCKFLRIMSGALCVGGKNSQVDFSAPALIPEVLLPLGRCGYGMRQPLIMVSAWAEENFHHSVTDLTSVLRSSKITGSVVNASGRGRCGETHHQH